MILPPNTSRIPTRRRPFGLYPDRPDWHTFVLGACVLVGLAAICLFIVAQVG